MKNDWDKKAIEYGTSEIGAHSDEMLVELENEFIERNLWEIKPNTILDVGCGNGRRSKRWAMHSHVTGIDSSEKMIDLARELENYALDFLWTDLHTFQEKCCKFDVVISARCLINLPTKAKQIEAIDEIYSILKPDGYFICCEGSKEGTERLNEMRELLGIEPIKVMETNLDLDDDVMEYICKKFGKKGEMNDTTLGTYYFITRVLTQTKLDLKVAAKILQLKYDDLIGICSLGRHFCFCGRK